MNLQMEWPAVLNPAIQIKSQQLMYPGRNASQQADRWRLLRDFSLTAVWKSEFKQAMRGIFPGCGILPPPATSFPKAGSQSQAGEQTDNFD
jgi:hypothetical protein